MSQTQAPGALRSVRVLAVSGAVLAAIYIYGALQLPIGHLDRPGEAIWPLVVGAVLLIASLAILSSKSDAHIGGEHLLPRGRDLARLGAALLASLSYVLLLPHLGNVIASTVTMLILVPAAGAASIRRTLVVSVLIVAVTQLVFVVLLKVPLPSGPFGR